MPTLNLLEISRGSVVAPAGCGKTHLIAQALLESSGAGKPTLVLTHTNAGVTALRRRLTNAGVSRSTYALSTLDGLALRLASTFPLRSGVTEKTLALDSPGTDYPAVQAAALQLVRSGAIADILHASYGRVLVDEYQDSSTSQHQLVSEVANLLPVAVLGDPLQAIFGFGDDPLPNWEDEVLTTFPVEAELTEPWRWKNAGSLPLGEWLLDARANLLCGEPVDLSSAPPSVQWVHLGGRNDAALLASAASTTPPNRGGSVLVLGHSKTPQRQHEVARSTPGASAVEAVALTELVRFAHAFDPGDAKSLSVLVDLAAKVVTQVPAATYQARLNSLKGGRARKSADGFERAALAFGVSPGRDTALEVLESLRKAPRARLYRPALFYASIKAISSWPHGASSPERIAVAKRIREDLRHAARATGRRTVGSTLLLKGLEADVAVVLDGGSLDARNLYVAMTRGSRRLVVCSEAQLIGHAK